MRVIMYHYVRNFNKSFPYYNYLDQKIFLKQLNSFRKKGICENPPALEHLSKNILPCFCRNSNLLHNWIFWSLYMDAQRRPCILDNYKDIGLNAVYGKAV